MRVVCPDGKEWLAFVKEKGSKPFPASGRCLPTVILHISHSRYAAKQPATAPSTKLRSEALLLRHAVRSNKA